MATPQKPVSLWRNRDYLLLWSGQLVSTVGNGISQIAYPLLALAITHSPAQTALVGAVNALSYILFVLPAGALLDRWNRKQVMIYCDIGRALCLASIPLAFVLGGLSILQICIVAFISGSLGVFFDIAELACLPQVVSKEQLPEALGRWQASVGDVSRRLAMTPDKLQSRINSSARLIILGSAPLGQVFVGLLLQYSTIQITIIVLVIGQIILAMVAMLILVLRHATTIIQGE